MFYKSKVVFFISLAIIFTMVTTGWCQDVKRLKDEMRMPWTGGSAVYLRDWLVCGVFPSPARPTGQQTNRAPSGQGFDTDYLNGESTIQPIAGDTVKRPDGSSAVWTQYTSDNDVVNFIKVFSGQQVTNAVAYAYTTIKRDEAGKVILALGSDDSVKVYLNGKLVHDHCIGRAVRKDEDIVPVTMEKENSLLIKVDNGTGDWGFSLRLLTETQALALESGEIQPKIEESPKDKPDLLIVNTDLRTFTLSTEPIMVEVFGAGGRFSAKTKTFNIIYVNHGSKAEFDTKSWQDGPYDIRVSRLTSEGKRVFRYLPWYKGDWYKQVIELLDQCDKLPGKLDEATAIHYRLLGDFVLDGLGGDPRTDKKYIVADGWRKIYSPLMEHRELQLNNAIRPNGFVRLSWKDEIDDSPQFARAYLPPDYDAKKKYPMIISLHGYNSSNPEYIHWWGVTERHNGISDHDNVILIEPHGRANTGYEGIGELDVLTVIQLAKKTFSVDEDHVYLMGYSMGGGGTWYFGTRHPELFAAIGPFYGGWDYHIEIPEEGLAKLTPYQKFDNESWSSFAQAEALLTTPVFVNHGDSDELVSPDQSRYVVRMLQRWGYNLRYWEHPGGGHGGFEAETELVRWFLTHTLNRNPMEVRVRSASLMSASAHWVRVEQREDPFAFILVNAKVADKHTIRLNTENVMQIRLSPGEKLIDHTSPVRVIWNDEDAGTYTFTDGAITLQTKGYFPLQPHKTPKICGPIENAQNTLFAIVVGTASKDSRMNKFCQLRAEAMGDEWQIWQHVKPRFFLDTEITDEQIGKYSLILFGGPDENLVTKKLIDQIPLRIESDSISISGQNFPAQNAGVSIIYPHPLNPDRYVVINASNSPDAMFFINRLPGNFDYSIAETRAIGSSEIPFEKGCVVAGCFDYNWQYSDKYAMPGDSDMRDKAPIRKAPKYLTATVSDDKLMLSELLETKSAGSFTYMERDLNFEGKPLTLDGKTYESGIGVQVWHDPCWATYDLTDGDWKHLKDALTLEEDAVKEIKSGLEIEKQKIAKTVILDDVDRYRVMEASFEGVRVILSYRGEKYSPEYIQGISGAAFRIAGICPCAPTCSGAMSTQDLPKLFGYEVNYISLNQESIDPKTQVNDVVALVKDEIRTGRPALVWNAFTNAEWDVVCGFDDEKKQFIGRGSYAGMEKYATADETRMTTFNPALGVIIIGDKTGEFKANKAELSALKEAVRHAHIEKEIPSDGKWVFLEGLQCYDRWVNEFKSDPNKKRGSGDSYCLGIYRSTHRAASGFMKELVPKYPEASSNFEKAAMYFSSEADALDKCDPLLGWNAPEGPDAERNNKTAELLSQARDNYAKGIGEIEQAIKLIESNAIPEPKIIQKEAFFVAGLRYEGKNEQGEIPAMWHDFAQRIGEIGIDISKPFVAYGVSRGIPNAASGVFEYLAAVEVKSIADLPQRMVGWEIPALTYAVFSVNGIPDIGRTFTLFNK